MYTVLEIHQKRNRSIHPLKLIPYHNHGETLLAVSCHATDTSKASHHQPVDHADVDTPDGNQDKDGANEEIEHVQTITTLMMKTRMKILKSMHQNNDDHAHSIMTSALHNYASILVLGSMF